MGASRFCRSGLERDRAADVPQLRAHRSPSRPPSLRLSGLLLPMHPPSGACSGHDVTPLLIADAASQAKGKARQAILPSARRASARELSKWLFRCCLADRNTEGDKRFLSQHELTVPHSREEAI